MNIYTDIHDFMELIWNYKGELRIDGTKVYDMQGRMIAVWHKGK